MSPLSSLSWRVRWRGRVWYPNELEELLRLCGRDPAILQEPAAVVIDPDLEDEVVCDTFQNILLTIATALGTKDALLFFHPQNTEEDWYLAGRLHYDLGGEHGPHALLLAQQRARTLVGQQPEREKLITAFLTGFVRRFLEDQCLPPQYCPLLAPQGVFLEVVPVRSEGTPPTRMDQEPTEASSGSTGWLLLQPGKRSPYVVCFPAPAPGSVQIDERGLNRPYPWW
ncbi:hypothetical protein [Thermogemmatispora carboxidivorans]|uniref:hypothetical protein n=1 Tax=Thermogemmatispora carboxidivorans TaxID=1382306 RepID=UPI00069BD8BC|nr:hypothetical protein [Thermogemmatispora carboxidivorans]